MRNRKKEKIAVALSGGVDSSVAAKILKDEGHELVGLFLKLWSDPKCTAKRRNYCDNSKALENARKVATGLKIPFYVINAEKEFKKEVVDYFLNEYKNLRTPNPCIVCNEKIKFDLLLKKALSVGCSYLATGHYARIKKNSNAQTPMLNQTLNSKSQKFENYDIKKLNGNWNLKIGNSLLKGIDETKDQSYMLYRLNQYQLSEVLFPLGEMKKSEVRKLAAKWNLPAKEREESQEICFIADKDFRQFLKRYLDKKYFKAGDIVNIKGEVLGRHDGLLNYTIGQRKLVNQELRIMNHEDKEPLYVVGFDIGRNRLIVGKDSEVYRKKMTVSDAHWIQSPEPRTQSPNLKLKIRYHHPEVACRIEFSRDGRTRLTRREPRRVKQSNNLQVVFGRKQRAITPGQSAVFYLGNEVIGGGIIS